MQEWICLECRATGKYSDLRVLRDRGTDTCCSIEVKNIDDVGCEGCDFDGDCNLDYRVDNCYT